MEVVQEKTLPPEQETTQVEAMGPTAKEMAAAEELNAARLKKQVDMQQQIAAQTNEEPVNVIGLAAKGHEALHAAMRAHQAKKKPEYVPPPRTERQMSVLQEELEAGRRSQQRAEAQQASRPVDRAEPLKEGFTTPVYRPGDMVPDPMTGKLGVQRDPS